MYGLITAELLEAEEVLSIWIPKSEGNSMFVGVILDKRIAPITERQMAI